MSHIGNGLSAGREASGPPSVAAANHHAHNLSHGKIREGDGSFSSAHPSFLANQPPSSTMGTGSKAMTNQNGKLNGAMTQGAAGPASASLYFPRSQSRVNQPQGAQN